MPILPLDYPEPYFATLGVMLYPATDEADPSKARAYVAQALARAFSCFRETGGTPPYDVLTPILMDAGEPLSDLQERWWGGRAAGELFKTFFALYNTDPALASWEHSIQIVELITENSEVKGSRTTLLEARDRFLTVAHLWGARAIRGGAPLLHPEIGYDERADFQSFLAEAEILRHWGQTWKQRRRTSKPPLPSEVWGVPENWEPPTRQPAWPKTGMIPVITLPQELLAKAKLKPAGRPRKRN